MENDKNIKEIETIVSIPSNGSSLFQWMDGHFLRLPVGLERLNPLKRVKFISIDHLCLSSLHKGTLSLNPLKRVKFISIQPIWLGSDHFYRLNPLKRVKFISMKGISQNIPKIVSVSQSPQTGQVYFNGRCRFASNMSAS